MDLESLEGEVLAGRFKLGRLLGEGGYGAVFEAEQLSVSRRVAVKVLHPRLVADGHNFTERFRAEAVATSRLSHSNSVIVYDFGEDPAREGLLFLAMEYLEGRSLNELIQERGALELELSVHLIEQIAASLHDAHGQGIVHRDVKPHNVMLIERDGDSHFAKVIDFGIAKVVQETTAAPMKSLTRTDTMIGTPHYMAPEQIHGDDELDGRTDQYALGITAYKMLAGRTPFDGGRQIEIVLKHLQEDAPPVSQMAPRAIPGAVDEVLSRALAKEPGGRYTTILEFARALRQASQAAATPSAPVTAHIDVDVSQDLREEPPTRPLDQLAEPEGGAGRRDPAQRSTNILFPLSAEEIRERERQMLESQRAAALEQTALAGPQDGPASARAPSTTPQPPQLSEAHAPPALSSSGPVRVPVRQESLSEVSEETGYTQAVSREEIDTQRSPSTIKTLAVERPAPETEGGARAPEAQVAGEAQEARAAGDTASIGREEASLDSLRGEEATGAATRPARPRARSWLLFGGVAFAAALLSISVAAWALRDELGPGEPDEGGELAMSSRSSASASAPEGEAPEGEAPEGEAPEGEAPEGAEAAPDAAPKEAPEPEDRSEPPSQPLVAPSAPAVDTPSSRSAPSEEAASPPEPAPSKVISDRPPADRARRAAQEEEERARREPEQGGEGAGDAAEQREEEAPSEPALPKTGEVRVVIIPGGTLHVGGQRREVGPDRIIELPTGSHQMWVEFTSGTRSPRRTVRVRAGERADVRFSDF